MPVRFDWSHRRCIGIGTYESYLREVLPRVAWFRAAWNNVSLVGFWSKLFDPAVAKERVIWQTEPIWQSPGLAIVGTVLSCSVVLALLTWAVWHARSRSECDRAFGLSVITMLLVWPLTWDHYLLLLLVPVALVWQSLPQTTAARTLFMTILAVLWMNPTILWLAFIPNGYPDGIANPTHTLTILSFQCYALLGLLAFGCVEMRSAAAAQNDLSVS